MTQLLGVDTTGSDWRSLRGHIQNRIEHLQRQLEGDLEDGATAKTRGRIQELRKLLADVEAPISEVDHQILEEPVY